MKITQIYKLMTDCYERIDLFLTRWMARYGLFVLRLGMGVVFFWFGALKLVPNLSPAETLVRNTIFFFDPDLFLPVLAIWEMLGGNFHGMTLAPFQQLLTQMSGDQRGDYSIADRKALKAAAVTRRTSHG